MTNPFDIQQHMEVLGSDGQHVGMVDRVEGERLKLTRSDINAGTVHHYLDLSMIDGVHDGQVQLSCSAAEARTRWHS